MAAISVDETNPANSLVRREPECNTGRISSALSYPCSVSHTEGKQRWLCRHRSLHMIDRNWSTNDYSRSFHEKRNQQQRDEPKVATTKWKNLSLPILGDRRIHHEGNCVWADLLTIPVAMINLGRLMRLIYTSRTPSNVMDSPNFSGYKQNTRNLPDIIVSVFSIPFCIFRSPTVSSLSPRAHFHSSLWPRCQKLVSQRIAYDLQYFFPLLPQSLCLQKLAGYL